MKLSGIYKIQSKIKPERIYIGSAVDIQVRWRTHLRLLNKNKHENSRLQNHYNKYGKNDFEFSILIGCDKQDLIITEQFYIDAFNPFFNICKRAGSSLGVKRSPETIRKVSEANRGEKHVNYGKHLSEETCRRISEAHLGRKHTPEHTLKVADKLRGIKRSDEFRGKISKGCKGVNTWSNGNKNACGKRTEESRKKMSDAAKDRRHSEETKRKMSAAHQNPSEEILRKRSEGLKKAWARRKLETINMN